MWCFEHAKLSKHQAPPPEQLKDIGTPMRRERVTQFKPLKVLSFTWGGEDASEVTIELTPQGDRVLLVLTHRKLADRSDGRRRRRLAPAPGGARRTTSRPRAGGVLVDL